MAKTVELDTIEYVTIRRALIGFIYDKAERHKICREADFKVLLPALRRDITQAKEVLSKFP